MRKLTYVAFLLISTLVGKAQHPYLFEDFSKNLYLQITDTNSKVDPEFIRVRVYRDLIDQQNWSDAKKEGKKIQMDKNYDALYSAYMRSITQLATYYRNNNEPAEITYISHKYSKEEGELNHVYQMQTRFFYKTDDISNMVTFHYKVAYLDNFLVLFSPITERF